MKKTVLFLLLGATLGIFAASVFKHQPPASSATPLEQKNKRTSLSKRSARSLSSIQSPLKSSTETVETLIVATEENQEGIYGKIALWLVDASPQEIQEYWDFHRAQENAPRDISDLLMVGWTSKDPEGALATVKGTSGEQFVWWAWACHDGQAAMARALESDDNADAIQRVGWGMGEFHPDWTRENFDSLPEGAKNWAMGGILKWPESSDPLATFTFALKEGSKHRRSPQRGLLRQMIRQDPMAAYTLIKEKGEEAGWSSLSEYGTDHNEFFQLLAQESPETLQTLIAQEESPEAVKEMQRATFDILAKENPTLALEQFQQESDTTLQLEQLRTLLTEQLRSDPSNAQGLLKQISENNGEILWAIVPDQVSNRNQANDLTILNQIGHQDPASMVEILSHDSLIENSQSYLNQFITSWANWDTESAQKWFGNNSNHPGSEHTSTIIAQQIARNGDHFEGLSWAQNSGIQNPEFYQPLYNNWAQESPDQAKQWLRGANLPEDLKNRLLAQSAE